ncbi:uridine diphosphate glucose pyrophosphatase NUDT22 isoform X2 [Rhincodon typus]|uniref:uridine diphosphate glucose pyrophosphatase NUDT22 isoform X2 n=1 Tax=Rhincodon typus TaxID=259920 RepID=UPI0009A42F3F|nr:uridine diphosphate glucose pyrophosphatase NUDT22 isoform X2 [Rhincodon typus]
MDLDVSLMVQCPFAGGLTQERVHVEISAEYNRRVLLSHEQKIADIWRQRKQEKPWLFNGAKFRIHSAQLESGGLLLRLGLTCYKDYLGTNWAPEARLLQEQGTADFGDSQAYLAEPLGVGAMLHTADDCFVFLRRSEQVAEAAAQVDIPGGHPEPKVNVPLESLSRPLLLGIARNHRSAGRPSAEFYIRCELTSEEVRQRYLIGGVEAHESTSISFVRQEDVLKLEEDVEGWRELCPSAKGAVKLYTLVRPSRAS